MVVMDLIRQFYVVTPGGNVKNTVQIPSQNESSVDSRYLHNAPHFLTLHEGVGFFHDTIKGPAKQGIKTSGLDVSVHTGYIEGMRTTLTLDDDVAMLLKKFTKESGLTFRDAVNQSIRRGLIARELTDVLELPQPRSMGKPTVDLTQALSLVESLNDAELIKSFRSTRDRS